MHLEYGGQRISVAAGDSLIGSDVAADLLLGGDAVLPRHAVVRKSGRHLVILPATAGARIVVNGSAVGTDPVPLLHGDRILVGTHEIRVADPDKAGPTRITAAAVAGSRSAPRPTPRLVSLVDGREYLIDLVPFVFGRDAAAEVVVESADASRRHAELVVRPDGDVLVDLSTNGTFVNGERIDGRRVLKSLDVIRIGAEEYRYYSAGGASDVGTLQPPGAAFQLGDTLMGLPRLPAQDRPRPAPVAARPLANLLIRSGAAKGERLLVRSAAIGLGRGEFNEVRLDDPSVSAGHARLQLAEGVWTLTDLGSTNGTWVDDIPVEDDVALSPGAIIRLGEVRLSFEPLDERPARVTPTAAMAAPRISGPAPRPTPVKSPQPARPRRSRVPFLLASILVLAAVLALSVLLA